MDVFENAKLKNLAHNKEKLTAPLDLESSFVYS